MGEERNQERSQLIKKPNKIKTGPRESKKCSQNKTWQSVVGAMSMYARHHTGFWQPTSATHGKPLV